MHAAPWITRRLVIIIAVGLVVLLAGTLAVVQVRAGQVQDRRDAAAVQAAQDRAAQQEAAQEEAARQAAAEEAERQAAADELAAQWAAASADAATRLAAADVVLAGSAGKVTDDGVRLALADAITAVRGVLEAAVDADAVQRLTQALDALGLVQEQVTAAQTTWQAEQDAAAAAEAQDERAAQADGGGRDQEPALGGPPSTGAGPDCGGPDSYEPPKNTGPTFYTSTPSATGSGSNGDIPADQMSPLGWCVDSQGNSQWLQSAAAAALTALNEAFRVEFGENIAVDMSYRSYQTQVEMRKAFGTVAAAPGRSNHGTGLAFDTWEWQAYAFGSARYEWLVAHAPEYGWVAPSWARQNGSNPEYWHFEYVG